MVKINQKMDLCLQLSRFQTMLNRRLDARLGGISFNELIILYHLNQAEGTKMRRIDLAEKVGLTASGITRLLLPMEKIGLVSKITDKNDGRVSQVSLSPGGKTKLYEGMERLELFCEDMSMGTKIKNIEEISKIIVELGKNI